MTKKPGCQRVAASCDTLFFWSPRSLPRRSYNEKTADYLLAVDGINLLHTVVEPLERELNPDYDRKRFTDLVNLKGSSGRGQPIG